MKYLVLRRMSQIGILVLFLLGPLAGIWIVKGNLAFSYTLDFLPVSDPYVLLQSALSGHAPASKALIGAAIALAFYLLVGGRVYCSWVCPMNVVTDAAAWLRRRLGIRTGASISRNLRYWVLAMTLMLALGTGTIAWELVNPVSILHPRAGLRHRRGMGRGARGVPLRPLRRVARLVRPRLPGGAFYSLIGRFSLLRVSAPKRADCDDCMDCYVACPEPQVITPALKSGATGASCVILSANCTNCGRCIDVCHKDVFRFGSRFSSSAAKTIHLAQAKEVP